MRPSIVLGRLGKLFDQLLEEAIDRAASGKNFAFSVSRVASSSLACSQLANEGARAIEVGLIDHRRGVGPGPPPVGGAITRLR